jgi:hypothetical protein
MSAQSSYERYLGNLMDADLAETIAAACCEKCGRELIDDEKIHCAKCEDKGDEQGS